MNLNESSRRLARSVVALSLVIAAASPFGANAADTPNLEGTWKISAVQSSFKPEGGAIPFTAEGRKKYQENKRLQAKGKYDDYDYTMARCASPGAARLMLTPERFRIWQHHAIVSMQFEWNRLLRQIDVGTLVKPQIRVGEGSSPTGGDDDAAVGRAIPISEGHWEGDTLVAKTTGFSENTLIDDLVPHGYDLKLTERIRLKDADTLEDRIAFEDPEYFTRPWETVVTYKRQPDAAFREDVCLDRLAAGQPVLSKPVSPKK